MAKRRSDRERGRREVTADMSEDLSEGEKGDTLGDLPATAENVKGRMRRVSSTDVMENWAAQQREKKLYIVLIRHELNFLPHFLIRLSEGLS